MKRIFVTPPGTHFDGLVDIKLALEAKGWVVVLPTDLDADAEGGVVRSRRIHDIRNLLYCDAIFISLGFSPYYSVARWVGIEVHYQNEGIPDGPEQIEDLPLDQVTQCKASDAFTCVANEFTERVDDWVASHESVLDEAARLTSADRQDAYGSPDENFARIAAMWSALFDIDFDPADVAIAMIAVKLSRESWQPSRENAVDIAGYANCLDICRGAE